MNMKSVSWGATMVALAIIESALDVYSFFSFRELSREEIMSQAIAFFALGCACGALFGAYLIYTKKETVNVGLRQHLELIGFSLALGLFFSSSVLGIWATVRIAS